ncbi:MAG: hypothetical protein NTZ09_02390 [Candidatus Hydrogenedentes bacterium]|nr:hypothetical protein [Candidatus Hydrogenedentota bacterium]
MKRRLFVAGVAVVFAAALCAVSVFAKEATGKEDGEIAVSWEKLPAPVQQVVQSQLGTDHPEQLTQETDDAYTTYEAAQKVNGQLKEVKVGDNGQLMEVEDAIAAADLPAAVNARLQKKAPKAEIKEIRRVTCYYYEIEIGEGGRTQELKVLGNGQEFEEED